ncbi:hypothetical protein B0H13DRAFT_2265564, partial [Mycena leptocephala]
MMGFKFRQWPRKPPDSLALASSSILPHPRRRTHSECPHIALKRLYHTGELLAPWSLHAPSCRYLNAWKPRGTRAWNKAARAHECIGFGLNAIVLVQSRSIGGDPKGHLDVEGSLGSKIAKLGERGSSGRYGRAVRMGIALALIHHHQLISSSPPVGSRAGVDFGVARRGHLSSAFCGRRG